MALPKNNQVKFRIDDHTKMAFKRVLENKKITIQSIMETLLIEYIIKGVIQSYTFFKMTNWDFLYYKYKNISNTEYQNFLYWI